jgi:hypothetical protein
VIRALLASGLVTSQVFTSEFHLCHKHNHPLISRLDILGDQTATFVTSGILPCSVAEERRLWQRRRIVASFVSRYVARIGVSKRQAPNVHAFETSGVAKLFRHGLFRQFTPFGLSRPAASVSNLMLYNSLKCSQLHSSFFRQAHHHSSY